MKKRIRLSESQLHRVIKEAVLDELDTRTYMNAAVKRAKQIDKAFDVDDNGNWFQSYSTYKTSPLRKKVAKLHGSSDDLAKKVTNQINNQFDPYDFYNYRFSADAEGPNLYTNTPVRFNGTASGQVSNDGDAFPQPIRDFFGHYQNKQCYYDKDKGEWVDYYDEDFDNKKNTEFWKQEFGESLIRRVTENVIRKLNEGLEELETTNRCLGIGDELKNMDLYFHAGVWYQNKGIVRLSCIPMKGKWWDDEVNGISIYYDGETVKFDIEETESLINGETVYQYYNDAMCKYFLRTHNEWPMGTRELKGPEAEKAVEELF